MISVVVCTHNRREMLLRTLDDLSRLSPVLTGLEILVVDNGSTDDTRDRMASVSHCGPYPLKYIREDCLGQSHARNRGIREAAGDWILFTDDDVVVDPAWAIRLPAELEALGVRAGGGRVVPVWPPSLPRWVTTEGPLLERIAFVEYSLSGGPRRLGDDDPPPVGCNMAIHRSLLSASEPFSPDLGHRGRRLLGGEDREFFARLRAAGVGLGYVPDALISHPVEPERLALTYLLRRRYWEGYGSAASGALAGRRRLFGVPLVIPKDLLRCGGECARAALVGDWPAAAHGLGGAFNRLGCLHGLLPRR